MDFLYGLFNKVKNQKLKMILLALMYTILFGVILLLIVCLDSIEKQTNFIETYVENEVTIKSKYAPIYEDTANEIKKLECVKDYNVMCFQGVRLKDCEPVIKDMRLYNKYLKRREEDSHSVWKQEKEFDPETLAQVRIIETNNTKNSAFFLNKGFYITKGRHVRNRDKDVALISEELAKENNLKVGDFFKTQTCKNDPYYGKALDMELKIIGIYEPPKSEFEGSPQKYESNYIFTSLGPVSQSYIAAYHRMTVYLKPGSSIDELKKQLSEESLYIEPKDYSFASSGEWSGVLSEPLQNMQNMSRILLVFMMICIIIIILLIGAFYVRGNLHNIGILLSIGVKRRKVIQQILAEECIPLLTGVLLAFLIGVGCVPKIATLVDHTYSSGIETVIAEKNKGLLNNTPEAKDIFLEVQMSGQVMRMDTDFETEYFINGKVFIIFTVFICIFFPVCLGLQILYKIKHNSIKQILLS